MIEAILNKYVENVPWKNYSTLLFDENVEQYARNIQEVLKETSKPGYKVDFTEDYWDLSPFHPDKDPEGFRIHFDNADTCFRDYLKLFYLFRLCQKISPRTITYDIKTVRLVLNVLLKKPEFLSRSTIETEDLIGYVEPLPVTPGTKSKYYKALSYFFGFMTCNFDMPILVDHDKLLDLSRTFRLEQKRMDSRTPSIPDEYFDKLLKACIAAIHDESLPLNIRMTAAEIILLTQIGARVEDMLNFKISDIKTFTFGLKVFDYIKFDMRKPTKADTPYRKVHCRLNELCMEAIRVMIEIGKELRRQWNCDYLYVLETERYWNGNYQPPIKFKHFRYTYLRTLLRLLPEESTTPSKDITGTPYGGRTVYAPKFKQYRVLVCTSLYRQGASLVNIRRSMGHMTDTMAAYYVRPKETYQQDRAEAARTVLKAIVKEGASPMCNPLSESMTATLKRFLDESNVNIEGSLDEIRDKTDNKVIIRSKQNGFCIRTGQTCAEDYKTDRILCAYDECPNIYYFYFDLPSMYELFKMTLTSYQDAVAGGFKKVAEKERLKLERIASKRLIPLLDGLEAQLVHFSENQIVEMHPEMESIVRIRRTIREEAERWTNRKEKTL